MLTSAQLAEFSVQAMWLVLMLSLPAVITAAVVALFVAIAQTVTSIQDQSIGQALRQVAVMGVLFITAPWMASELTSYGSRLLSAVAQGKLAP